jgi:rhodanese-related sulfurtransferase
LERSSKRAGDSYICEHKFKNKIMKEINQEEWREKIAEDDDAVILDVRTEQEVEEGYIPGAKVIDIYKGQEFIDEIDKLDKSKNYYVYCRSGNRSGQACTIMDQKGFKNTYNLLGGFSQWEGEKTE